MSNEKSKSIKPASIKDVINDENYLSKDDIERMREPFKEIVEKCPVLIETMKEIPIEEVLFFLDTLGKRGH